MTNLHNKKLGAFGEQLAIKYMLSNGFTLIAQNVHTRYSELDLIFCKNDFYIFLEVKTRLHTRYDIYNYSLNSKKILKLRKGVAFYIKSNPKVTHYALEALCIDLSVSRMQHYKHLLS